MCVRNAILIHLIQRFIMKKTSTFLYVVFALLFIVGIIIKNKYVIAAGFLLAAIYFAIYAVSNSKKKKGNR